MKLSPMHTLYRIIFLPAFFVGVRGLGLFHKKIRQSIKGRKHLFSILDDAQRGLPPGVLRFWIHNSSMGEFEQAKPLIRGLKRRFPDAVVVVSFLSPSGFDHVHQSDDIDLICYIPFDTKRNAKRFLDLIQPDVVVVVRHDIWPNHLRECMKRGIPTLLVNSSINPRFRDRIPPKLWIHRYLFRHFSSILTVSEESMAFTRANRLGNGEVISVGDTRYDQVVTRARQAESVVATLQKIKSERICVVAGSTWPSDEEVLLNALYPIYREGVNLWTVLVPHEPSPDHIEGLEIRCSRMSLQSCRLSELKSKEGLRRFDILIVDRIGILASLYALGDITYVGGGFGVGIHNVLEPAAHGRVVFFGPHCRKSYEAGLLRSRGVGWVVKNDEELNSALRTLLEKPERMTTLGQRAGKLVEEHVGATQRIIDHVDRLLNPS